jgi:hypothetical protein
MNNRSAYGNTFGEGPLSKDDYKVSPAYFKTLCGMLRPEAAQYIEKWLKINDQEEFAKRIITTLRELFTVVKHQAATVSTALESYEKKSMISGSVPPRFDVAETLIREKKRSESVVRNGGFKPTKKYPANDPNYKMPHFEPLLNASQEKQGFLKGQLDAVYYLKPEIENFTHYLGNHNGLQVAKKDRARIIDPFRVTCGGVAIPDPQTVGASEGRFSRYRQETEAITDKIFQTNAINSFSPRHDWGFAKTAPHTHSFKFFKQASP